MNVFDPGFRQFAAQDVLAESSLVTPRGLTNVSDDADARSFQLRDVRIYVHSLIAEGVEVQRLAVASVTRAGDRMSER